MLRADGVSRLAADGYYLPELRRGLGEAVHVRVQAGVKLREVYWPAHYLIHHAAPKLYVEPVGYVWTGDEWEPDPRTGERIVAGLTAVERRDAGGEMSVSLPELGRSHHDEAVAAMRMLWDAGAATESKRHGYGTAEHRYAGLGSSLSDRMAAR
jgi:hypothetical protein